MRPTSPTRLYLRDCEHVTKTRARSASLECPISKAVSGRVRLLRLTALAANFKKPQLPHSHLKTPAALFSFLLPSLISFYIYLVCAAKHFAHLKLHTSGSVFWRAKSRSIKQSMALEAVHNNVTSKVNRVFKSMSPTEWSNAPNG